MVRRIAAMVLLLLAGALAPAAHATRGLTTGFALDPALTDGSTTANDVWIPRAVAEGAGMVRVDVPWSQVAPATRPAGFAASNPASPGNNWTNDVGTACRASASSTGSGGKGVLAKARLRWVTLGASPNALRHTREPLATDRCVTTLRFGLHVTLPPAQDATNEKHCHRGDQESDRARLAQTQANSIRHPLEEVMANHSLISP